MAHKIEDFGEKIGGAKKDLWKTRGMLIEDLNDINDLEIAQMVCKDNIWPKPDWENYIPGVSPEVLYFIRLVREKLPSKLEPRRAKRENAEVFITTIRQVKEYCENDLKEFSQCKDFYKNFCMKYGYINSDGNGYSEKAYSNPLFGSNWVRSVQLSTFALERLESECKIQNFPKQFRGDMKGMHIRKTTRNGQSGYIICKSGTYTEIVSDTMFDTPEAAYEFAHTELIEKLDKKKAVGTVTRKGAIKVVRPQLNRIERTGPDIRKGHDCNSDIFIDDFKFRGGEFGNWNNDNDRQACLNYAFDAFCDLAYVLDIPIQGVSL